MPLEPEKPFSGSSWSALPEPGALGLFALLTVYVALWLLLTPYVGLTHDAQAYAFQALARIDPAVLGQDIFLRYESQDRYTIFPQAYALLIQQFGLEATASGLTLACHVIWYGAAYLVSHRLFGAPLALLAIGLVVAIPGSYGGQSVFHFAEPFLTARLPAETLSLLALWIWLRGDRSVAIVTFVLATLIHPLMAFPVFLLAVLLTADAARAGRCSVPLVALAIVVCAVTGSVVLGGDSASMHEAWLESARMRSGFLFLDQWQPGDWNNTLLSVVTLAIASIVLVDSPARSAVWAAFWLALAGLLLAALASEVWHLKILMQGQPWRWLWLARFLAIAALPATCYSAWQSGPAGRAAALLLSAAWLTVVPVSTRTLIPMVMGSILAIAALFASRVGDRLPGTTQRLLQRGSIAILVLVLFATVVTASLRSMMISEDLDLSQSTQRLLRVLALITPAVVLVVVAWSGSIIAHARALPVAIAAGGSALLVAAVAFAVPKWTDRTYSGENFAHFADWREVIPRDAEVFWWNGLREVWFLLDRRSYLTVSQTGGVVFSSEASVELHRRAESLRAFIDPRFWFNMPAALKPLTHDVLASICRDPALGFVVSQDDIGVGAPAKDWPRSEQFIYLYDCGDYRPGQAQ